MRNAKTMQERREAREEWIAAGILPPPPTSKRCTHCHRIAPLDDFPPSRPAKDGRSSWCRSCHNEATRQWKVKRKEKRDA